MARVTFTAPFYFTPPGKAGRVTIRYETGQSLQVTRGCAAAAVKAGKARRAVRPSADPAKAAGAGGRDAIRPTP